MYASTRKTIQKVNVSKIQCGLLSVRSATGRNKSTDSSARGCHTRNAHTQTKDAGAATNTETNRNDRGMQTGKVKIWFYVQFEIGIPKICGFCDFQKARFNE